jgi:integrase
MPRSKQASERSERTPFGTYALGWILWGYQLQQQKLMRHSDIRTTMNVYGDVVDDRMKEARLPIR